MPTKVFVGRIAEGTTGDDIRALFRKFGNVVECDVIANYGFVHMETEDEAKAAIAALDGYNVNGSQIHVELSTANTQGRKKRGFEPFGGGRFEPYSHHRRDNFGDTSRRSGEGGSMPPERVPDRAPREEYASEQVKDLLELYFRDPYAFDQYARTYYYGERAERSAVAGGVSTSRGYYDKRPDIGYASSRR